MLTVVEVTACDNKKNSKEISGACSERLDGSARDTVQLADELIGKSFQARWCSCYRGTFVLEHRGKLAFWDLLQAKKLLCDKKGADVRLLSVHVWCNFM